MLSFNALRKANIARLPLFKNAQGEPAHSKPDGSDWSVSEWLEAVTGELGEFANLHKKLRRGDFKGVHPRMMYPNTPYGKRVQRMLANELADVAVYLDILAYRLGIDLGEAVKSKWDETSQKVGLDLRIGDFK